MLSGRYRSDTAANELGRCGLWLGLLLVVMSNSEDVVLVAVCKLHNYLTMCCFYIGNEFGYLGAACNMAVERA